MPLTVTPNNPLNRPSLRVLVELDLATTIRVATEDIYPAGALGGVLFEKRLEVEPTLALATGSEFGGIQRVEECSCTLSNHDGSLNVFFSSEQRGKAARVHLYDKETAELQQNVFRGVVSSFDFDLHTVAVSLVNMDFAKLGETAPSIRVTKTTFPNVPRDPAPSGGLGDLVPYGWGVASKIPGRFCRAWNGTATDSFVFDYVFGVGNLGLDLVWRNGTSEGDTVLNDPQQYVPLYLTYSFNGRRMTAVRFYNDMRDSHEKLLPITADVQRVYPDVDGSVVAEWKWKSTFRDDIAGGSPAGPGTVGRHATAGAGSGLTTASLVAGPTGVGLGAVLCDGINDFLEVIDATATLTELMAFTLETWVRADAATKSVVILGAQSTLTSGTVLQGYGIEYDAAASKFRFRALTTSGLSSVETPATIQTGRYYYLACVRDIATSTTKLYLDGVLVATDTKAGTVVYSGTQAFNFSTNVGVWYFPGAIGYTRFSRTARDARYVQRAYWLMRRNGIEFLRDFLETERGYTIDTANFDTATTDWDNIPTPGAGALKVDGYVTEDSTEQAIIESLTPFRDLRLGRNTAGAIQVFVAKAATTVTAQFGTGIGEQYGNVVSINRRLRASLAEAVKTQPIHYRAQRNDDGTFTGFQFTEMAATGLTVGRTGDPLQLPFVYDHTTADLIRDFRGKRIVTRDELMEVTLGHEARALSPGKIVRLTVPALGIAAKDYEVLGATTHRPSVDAALVPYAETDYTTYTPGTLPTDPSITTSLSLNLGTHQEMTLVKSGTVAASSAAVSITLELSDSEQLFPTGAGALQESTPVVGAATRFAAINPADPSGDSGYVVFSPTGSVNRRDTYTFQQATIPAGQRRRRLRFHIRIRKLASLGCSFGPCVRLGGVVADAVGSAIVANPAFTNYTLNVETNPVTQQAWTLDELQDPTLQLGYWVLAGAGGDTVQVAECFVDFMAINDQPTDCKGSALWHSLSPTPPPPASDPYVDINPFMFLTHKPVTTVGAQYYFARLLDKVGRIYPTVITGNVTFAT